MILYSTISLGSLEQIDISRTRNGGYISRKFKVLQFAVQKYSKFLKLLHKLWYLHKYI